MDFKKKSFESVRSIVLSDRPIYAASLEERISSLLPAMEAFVDSFESYLPAYNHCSELRNVGMIYLHLTDNSSFPVNAINELAAPYESGGSLLGFYIFAENEKCFTQAYKNYGTDQRLLGINLESELENETSLKNIISGSWEKFEQLQKSIVLPNDELVLFERISSGFGNLEMLKRLTKVITSKLDMNWFENTLVDAGPSIMLLPDDKKWVLTNSKTFQRIQSLIEPYKSRLADDLMTAKDDYIVLRSVVLSYQIYLSTQTKSAVDFLDKLSGKPSAFSPTLKKIIHKEKSNLLDIINQEAQRQAA